jgi:hypothetical protein
MNKAFHISFLILSLVLVSCLVITGCNYPYATPVPTSLPPTKIPTAAPTAALTAIPTEKPTSLPTPKSHELVPFNGMGKEQVIHDQVDKNYASQKRAFGGDEYKVGRFERPFDRNMEYLGYLDIVKSTMVRNDPRFIYVTLQMAETIGSAEKNPAYYGLELDLNLDGRSLYLIRGSRPLTEKWTVDGVDVWKSTSSEQPLAAAGSNIPVTGAAGFDVSVLLAGKGNDIDLAWIRLSPGLKDTVEIAFKNTLVGGEKGKFIWRPFTDGAPFEPGLYDLQNSYTLEQAGSPIIGEKDYPLKAVFAVDNTCRVTSGYDATGREPGICIQPPGPEKPDEPSSPPGIPHIPGPK